MVRVGFLLVSSARSVCPDPLTPWHTATVAVHVFPPHHTHVDARCEAAGSRQGSSTTLIPISLSPKLVWLLLGQDGIIGNRRDCHTRLS